MSRTCPTCQGAVYSGRQYHRSCDPDPKVRDAPEPSLDGLGRAVNAWIEETERQARERRASSGS